MKAIRWLLAATAIVACADSEPNMGSGEDAGPPGIVPPAPPSDAGADVTEEADAPAKICSNDGWCHSAVPPKVKLSAVWGDAAGVVWAVAEGGEILRWEADTWKVHAKLDGPLRAIWGSGPTDIWVAGKNGLFHGQGASSAAVAFTAIAAPGDPLDPIVSIWGAGPKDVWAVGGRVDVSPHTGRVIHYAGAGDAGPAWSLVDTGTPDVVYSHVWGTPKSGVWMAGVFYDEPNFSDVGVVLRKGASAGAFAEIKMPADPNDMFAGGLGFVRAVDMIDGSLCLLGETLGWRPSAWRGVSTDDGKTFTFAFHGGSYSEQRSHAVSQLAPSDTWAAGDYGRLRHWDGTEWKQSAITLNHLPLTSPFYAMWRSPAKELWVVGEGIALRRDLSK